MALRSVLQSTAERRLVILALILFVLFAHWGGTNADSRYMLTKAMVEDGSVEITPYHDGTLDKRILGVELREFVNETELREANQSRSHQIILAGVTAALESPRARMYSDKAPLSSILAIPGYIIGDSIATALDLSRQDVMLDTGISTRPVEIATADAATHFVIMVTVSVLFGVLLLLLLYRDLAPFLGKHMAVYTVFVAGFATFLFHYATSFYGVITAAALGYASYHVLHNYADRGRAWLYLSGILGGLALSTEYYAGLIPAGIVLYQLTGRRFESVKRYVGGVIVGMLPLFIYTYIATGNPVTPLFFQGMEGLKTGVTGPELCSLYPECYTPKEVMSFVFSPLRAANAGLRLLLSPTRGLLFYAPVLLLALPGIRTIYRRDRRLLLITPGVFLLFFLFQSFQLNWLAGVSFGPRYMVVGLPFLVLPLGLGLKQVMARGRLWRVLALILIGVSLFHMLLGFHEIPALDVDRETYTERFQRMEPVQPSVYGKLLDDLQTYGVRSELLWSVARWRTGAGITHSHPYWPQFLRITDFNGIILLLKLALIPVVLLLLTAILLWPGGSRYKLRCIADTLPETVTPWRSAAVLVLGIGMLHGAGSIGSVTDSHLENWYVKTEDDLRHWGYKDPTIYVRSPHQNAVLEYSLRSHDRPRNITVTVNGDRYRRMTVFPEVTEHVLDAPFKKGINRIMFHTEGGCTPLNATDPRCVTIGIANRTWVTPQRDEIVAGANAWKRDGVYRMRRNASLYTYGRGRYLLAANAKSIGGATTLRIFKDGVPLTETHVDAFGGPLTTPLTDVDRTTVFTFQTGCPAHCDLINVSNLTLQRFEEQSTEYLFRFGNNWYHNASGEIARWSSGNATIYVYNYDDRPQQKEMWIRASSFTPPENITFVWNGNATPSKHFRVKYLLNVTLRPGENMLKIGSTDPCTDIGALNNNDDVRCALFGFKNLYLLDP